MTPSPDAGYDSVEETSKDVFVTFYLEAYKTMHTASGMNCRLMRNGKPVGMIHLESEEEFNLLKRRVDGTFDIETGALTIVDPI